MFKDIPPSSLGRRVDWFNGDESVDPVSNSAYISGGSLTG